MSTFTHNVVEFVLLITNNDRNNRNSSYDNKSQLSSNISFLRTSFVFWEWDYWPGHVEVPVAGETEGGGGGVGPHDGWLLSPDDLAGLDVPTGHTVPGQRVRDGEMLIFSPAKLRVSFY